MLVSFFSRVMPRCLPLVLLLASCLGRGEADDELLVFAATSLTTDAMTEAAAEFETASGTKVKVSFGPSRAGAARNTHARRVRNSLGLRAHWRSK